MRDLADEERGLILLNGTSHAISSRSSMEDIVGSEAAPVAAGPGAPPGRPALRFSS